MYEASSRVPMIIAGPGVQRGRVVVSPFALKACVYVCVCVCVFIVFTVRTSNFWYMILEVVKDELLSKKQSFSAPIQNSNL